jgi:AcrR family transcriptional regulator
VLVFSFLTMQTVPVPTAKSARERVRREITGEILQVARAHLEKEGPAALSLRSIARELEIAPSALYRYFDGRDELLTALIQTAYESLAHAAELAASEAEGEAPSARFSVVPRAMRAWALEHRNEWALIFGSPVPGYDAPETTVVPYARLAAALVSPVIDARTGHSTHPSSAACDSELAESLRPVIDGLMPGMPANVVAAAMRTWALLIGVISLEVFGHWRNTVLEPSVLFESVIIETAASLGLT